MSLLQRLMEHGVADFVFMTKRYRLEYDFSKGELVLICNGPRKMS